MRAGEWGPRMMTVTDTSIRWRWACILKAADGGVSAVTTIPSSGLGGTACWRSAALPEEAGTQRVPALGGNEEGLGRRNLDRGQGRGLCICVYVDHWVLFCLFLGKKTRVRCRSASLPVSHSSHLSFVSSFLLCVFLASKNSLFSMPFYLSFFLFIL